MLTVHNHLSRRGLICALSIALIALAVSGAPVRAASPSTAYLPLAARGLSIPFPSSEELIDRALASGAIDTETALIYKVYAAFGDARLPSQYRGDEPLGRG